MTEEAAGARPTSVRVALRLLGGYLVIGLVPMTLSLWRVYRDPPMVDGRHISGAFVALPAVLVLVVLAVMVLVLWSMAKGERWAYITFLVVTVLGLPSVWSGLKGALERGGAEAVLFVMIEVVQAVAVILLLRRPARDWYGLFRKVAPIGGAWHEDPWHRHQLRFWSGTEWTPSVSDDGQVTLDPITTGPDQRPGSRDDCEAD